MSNNKLHINPLNRKYPKPEIPVKDAWKKMNQQLNANSFPASKSSFKHLIKKPVKATLKHFFRSSVSKIMGVVSSVSILTVVVLNTFNEPQKSNLTRKPIILTDTIQQKSSVSIEDSVFNVNKKVLPLPQELITSAPNGQSKEASNLQIIQGENAKTEKKTSIQATDSSNKEPNSTSLKSFEDTDSNLYINKNSANKTTIGTTKVIAINNLEFRHIDAIINKISTLTEQDFLKNDSDCFRLDDIVPIVKQKPEKKTSVLVFKDLHIGLQWNTPIPQYGFDNYNFAILQNNQALLNLTPELLVSKNICNSNKLILKFNPYFQQLSGSKQISSNTSTLNTRDSINSVNSITKTVELQKCTGISFGAEYNHLFRKNWIIGGGVSYCNINQVLIKTSNFNNTTKRTISQSYSRLSADSLSKALIHKNTFSITLSASYQIGNFEIGSSLYVPVGVIKSYFSPKLSGQLFIRWRLF